MIELTADVSEFFSLGHYVDFLLFQIFQQAVFRIWTGLSDLDWSFSQNIGLVGGSFKGSDSDDFIGSAG